MDGVDVRAVVAGIPLFAETLDDEQLRALAHKTAPVIFPAGTILMNEGDFATSMFALVEGRVTVEVADQAGGARHVANLKAGEIAGPIWRPR